MSRFKCTFERHVYDAVPRAPCEMEVVVVENVQRNTVTLSVSSAKHCMIKSLGDRRSGSVRQIYAI